MSWIITCPNCGTDHQVDKSEVAVECGIAVCSCTCANCSHEYQERIEYWRWLGLVEAPADLLIQI